MTLRWLCLRGHVLLFALNFIFALNLSIIHSCKSEGSLPKNKLKLLIIIFVFKNYIQLSYLTFSLIGLRINLSSVSEVDLVVTFQCADREECIAYSLICDGNSDCQDASDEDSIMCSTPPCDSKHSRGHCIPKITECILGETCNQRQFDQFCSSSAQFGFLSIFLDSLKEFFSTASHTRLLTAKNLPTPTFFSTNSYIKKQPLQVKLILVARQWTQNYKTIRLFVAQFCFFRMIFCQFLNTIPPDGRQL